MISSGGVYGSCTQIAGTVVVRTLVANTKSGPGVTVATPFVISVKKLTVIVSVTVFLQALGGLGVTVMVVVGGL